MSSTPEQREKWKQQRERHKDKQHEYAKQFYQLNKEHELQRTKQWRESNPDKVVEYNNKSLIQQSEKVVCDTCGCESTRHNLKRHKQSNRCTASTLEQNSD